MTTKQQIIELKKKNPVLRTSDIARLVGVSREWVRRVLKQEGLPTTLTKAGDVSVRLCARCGKAISRAGKTGLCLSCYNHNVSMASKVKLVCAVCGKEFYRRRSLVGKTKTGTYYCSRTCWSKVLGRRFGFGAHRPRQESKYDAQQILELKSHGWTLEQIATEVGGTKMGVWGVLKRHGLVRSRGNPASAFRRAGNKAA